ASEIQKAALHLEPSVSAHLLGSQLVFGFFVKTVGAGCIAHLALEMCQTSKRAPRLLAFQNFDVTMFRRLRAHVLKVEVGPGRPVSSTRPLLSQRSLRRYAASPRRSRERPPSAHQGSARYGKSARNSLSFFSGLGGVFGSIRALFHSPGSLSRSTWYFLPLRL